MVIRRYRDSRGEAWVHKRGTVDRDIKSRAGLLHILKTSSSRHPSSRQHPQAIYPQDIIDIPLSPNPHLTSSIMQLSILALAAILDLVAGQYKFCTDGKCSDCPTSISNLGTGFPKCLVYSTEDVFFNQPGFNGSEGGSVPTSLPPHPTCLPTFPPV